MLIVSSATFCGVASLIYKFKRTLNGAVIGLLSSVVATTGIMLLMNVLLTPIYQGVDRSIVISMLPTLFLPFNFAKTLLNSSIVMFIYKPVVTALRKAKVISVSGKTLKFNRGTVCILLIGAVAMAASIAIFVAITELQP